MLAWTIYISFIGAALVCIPESSNHRAIRALALLTTVSSCLLAFAGVFQLMAAPGVHTIVKIPWIPQLGIQYHLAADGISVVLVLLGGEWSRDRSERQETRKESVGHGVA